MSLGPTNLLASNQKILSSLQWECWALAQPTPEHQLYVSQSTKSPLLIQRINFRCWFNTTINPL
ncbi:MAG: hypothetical protein CK430_08570 [Legionella sp.]|nr:MAG: hypothetical protein CK430_08570 [Legionella sp.]